MANHFLMVVCRLVVLYGSDRNKLSRCQFVTICTEDTDIVPLEKIGHRLSNRPVSSQYCRSGAVSQHQACVVSTDKVDATGQFIKDQLQQGQAGLCLCMHTTLCQ